MTIRLFFALSLATLFALATPAYAEEQKVEAKEPPPIMLVTASVPQEVLDHLGAMTPNGPTVFGPLGTKACGEGKVPLIDRPKNQWRGRLSADQAMARQISRIKETCTRLMAPDGDGTCVLLPIGIKNVGVEACLDAGLVNATSEALSEVEAAAADAKTSASRAQAMAADALAKANRAQGTADAAQKSANAAATAASAANGRANTALDLAGYAVRTADQVAADQAKLRKRLALGLGLGGAALAVATAATVVAVVAASRPAPQWHEMAPAALTTSGPRVTAGIAPVTGGAVATALVRF